MFKKFVKERLRRTVDTFSRVASARHRRSGADKIMARRLVETVTNAWRFAESFFLIELRVYFSCGFEKKLIFNQFYDIFLPC